MSKQRPIATVRINRLHNGHWWAEVLRPTHTGDITTLVHMTADFAAKAEARSAARRWAEARGYEVIGIKMEAAS